MAFWHMQLHPNDLEWKREEELLENMSLIGLGLASDNQAQNFRKSIKVNDLVLIRRGAEPIALVEVVGDIEDNLKNDLSALDWFRYRRKVKVLDFFNKSKLDMADKPTNDFPSPRGTLSLAKDPKSPTYQYILSWHKSLFPELYQTNDSLKIREVSISNYKIFNNTKIDFTDKNNKPLPIVVLAGINGSGKTTLLEYINNFIDIVNDSDRSYIGLDIFDKKLKNTRQEELRFYSLWDIKKDSKEESFLSKFFKEKIFYFKTGTNISKLKEFLKKYIKKIMYQENLRPSDVFDRVREKIDKIFQDLDILVEFDKVDEEDNVFFRNKKDETFFIDEISTGEKTLLSKILYLYLNDIKDGVILIDEPELSLHPAWQNKVLKLYENFAKENNCQIIIATHSPHIIGSAKNEYIRLLTTNENNEIRVIDKDVYAHGRDINSILFDVMNEARYRPLKEFDEKIDYLYHYIDEQEFDKAKEILQELEKNYGKNDKVILEAKMTIDMLSHQDL